MKNSNSFSDELKCGNVRVGGSGMEGCGGKKNKNVWSCISPEQLFTQQLVT